MVQMISYDLRAPVRDYTSLYQAIGRLSPNNFALPLESQWLIRSNLTSLAVAKALQPFLDADDRLLVTPVHLLDAAWINLEADAVAWIRANLN